MALKNVIDSAEGEAVGDGGGGRLIKALRYVWKKILQKREELNVEAVKFLICFNFRALLAYWMVFH